MVVDNRPRSVMRLDNSKTREIRFRVPSWMKEDFTRLCEVQDVPAAHLLRRYIRDALRENSDGIE